METSEPGSHKMSPLSKQSDLSAGPVPISYNNKKEGGWVKLKPKQRGNTQETPKNVVINIMLHCLRFVFKLGFWRLVNFTTSVKVLLSHH